MGIDGRKCTQYWWVHRYCKCAMPRGMEFRCSSCDLAFLTVVLGGYYIVVSNNVKPAFSLRCRFSIFLAFFLYNFVVCSYSFNSFYYLFLFFSFIVFNQRYVFRHGFCQGLNVEVAVLLEFKCKEESSLHSSEVIYTCKSCDFESQREPMSVLLHRDSFI